MTHELAGAVSRVCLRERDPLSDLEGLPVHLDGAGVGSKWPQEADLYLDRCVPCACGQEGVHRTTRG